MLLRAVLNGPHRFHGPLVMHVDVQPHTGIGLTHLFVRVIAIIVAGILQGRVIGQAVLLKPLFAHQRLVDRIGETGEHRIPVTGFVIDRHMPLGDRHLA